MNDAERRDKARISAPQGLRTAKFQAGGDEYMVLSYPAPEWSLPPGLSPAEREVALALLAGDSYEQIAGRRGTSLRTVANQVRSIYEKLNVDSRLALAQVSLAKPRPLR